MPRPKSVAWPKCCAHARGLGGSTARLCLWHSNGHARYRGHALGHVVRGVALDIIIRWEAFVLVEDNSDHRCTDLGVHAREPRGVAVGVSSCRVVTLLTGHCARQAHAWTHVARGRAGVSLRVVSS
jgi:hypothetical protein